MAEFAVRADLQNIRDFFDTKIRGWMMNDIEVAIKGNANFLAALGCLTYTQIVGSYLPPLPFSVKGGGSQNRRAFNQCLFRLKSGEWMKNMDQNLVAEGVTDGLYAVRNGMTHNYLPTVTKHEGGRSMFLTSTVAKAGVLRRDDGDQDTPPLFIDDQGRVVIALQNYLNEFKEAVDDFWDHIFEKNEKAWTDSVICGVKKINKDFP